MKTRIITEDIEAAAEIIKAGGLVAVPTETVYGLACNGLDEKAVGRVYEVKGRPEVKPLSLMVPGPGAFAQYCVDIPQAAYFLAERFWPGPLTIVLKSDGIVPSIVRVGGETVALRCPDHKATLALLEKAGLPLAAPSANPSGLPSPKTAQEVLSYFDGAIDAVIDGGECGVGRESTIIDLSAVPYRILREGALSETEVFSALAGNVKIIGITGGTGGGKTTALNVLKEMGALTIDCDEVYHRLTTDSADMLFELETRFPGVVRDGVLQRKLLGEMVFSDISALMDLNAITHRYVIAEVDRQIAQWARMGGRLAAIDAIALIESGLARRCAAVVGITAPREVRIERLMAREGISREYAEKRIDAQQRDDFFRKNCDYVLVNDKSPDEFRKKCEELFRRILS
jgi:tRNA threonylcarbamoyl adenosine modification protein (Sua5/YciO/YrdC/YwlC family)/dephospho-CoA kinase